jgi:hypothetical protein
MGAKYKQDWCKEATHLVAVAVNTPKVREAQQNPKAKIVKRDWIKECFDKKKRLDEEDYSLTGSSGGSSSNRGKKRKLDVIDDDDDEEDEADFEDDGYDSEEQREPDDDYEPDTKKVFEHF